MRKSASGIPAVFIEARASLEVTGGGVQICNRELMAVLAAAGFSVQTVPFELDRRLWTRIANRIRPSLRPVVMPPSLARIAEEAVVEKAARYTFFGLTHFVELSKYLRARFPLLRQVILSHGVETIDFCIDQQIRRRTGAENRPRRQAVRMLGEGLLLEAEQRRYIDAAIVLSPFEAEVEKWLGTPAVHWVPRTIMETALNLQPINGRVGCVSTLNHSPNCDGLMRLFEELARLGDPMLRFRLVGSPDNEGRALAAMFPFVEYLGTLDDAALRREASTWSCFVHPLFVYAKGCSTKLAVALGWRLPVATTEFGARGYCWDTATLPLARTPAQLAQAVIERSRADRFQSFQRQTLEIIAQTPSLAAVADQIRLFLRKI